MRWRSNQLSHPDDPLGQARILLLLDPHYICDCFRVFILPFIQKSLHFPGKSSLFLFLHPCKNKDQERGVSMTTLGHVNGCATRCVLIPTTLESIRGERPLHRLPTSARACLPCETNSNSVQISIPRKRL